MYQEKGMPYTLVSVDDYGSFVDGWRSKDVDLYNKFMYKLILDSYNYFYGNQSVNEAIFSNSKAIINQNRGKKR